MPRSATQVVCDNTVRLAISFNFTQATQISNFDCCESLRDDRLPNNTKRKVLTNANLARTQEEIFQHNFCKKTWALTPVSIICRHPISVGPKMNSCIVNEQSLSAHQLTVTRSINRTAYTAVKIKMAMLLIAVHTIRTYSYSIPLRSDPHNSRCERASLVRLRWSVNPVLRSQLSNYRIP